MIKRVIKIVLAGILIGAGVELFARTILGLGSPPLTVAHPTIEYMFKPNQDVWRFHNHISYNEYGMRSPSPNGQHYDRMIMAFGDSVINGGNLTDNDDLATTIASKELSQNGKKVFVGNISAGSWGPGNIRAWIEEYGLFDADSLIFVLSSHDFTDQPTFAPLDQTTHPTTAPISAFVEAIQRYLPRYLPISFLSPKPQPNPYFHEFTSRPPVPGKDDIKRIIELSEGKRICLIQNRTIRELRDGDEAGYAAIKGLFKATNAITLNLDEFFNLTSHRAIEYHRDNIHLNALGQRALASAILRCTKN